MAAPTLVAESESSWANAAAGAKTISVTVNTNDALVIFAITEEAANITVSTPTGGGLTYSLRQSHTTGSNTAVYLWTATAASNQTFTLSVSSAGGTGLWGFNCLRYSGSSGFGNSNKAQGSGAPSVSVTTTAANSALVVASGDWNAIDGTVRTPRTTDAGAFTEQTYFRNSASATVYGGYHADAGTAAAKAVGWSAPAGQKFSVVAIEVLGTSSTSKSSSDTASGSDAGTVSATVSSVDTGAGTDAGTLATAVSTSDTATGADSPVSIAQSATETATGADATAAKSGTAVETATAVDAGSATATGSGTDTSGTAEGSVLAVSVSSSDTASAVENHSLQAGGVVSSSDTSAAVDAGTLSVVVTGADTSSAVDAGSVSTGATPSGTESSGAQEAASLTVALSSSDSAAGTDAGTVGVSTSSADAAGGADAQTAGYQLTGAETVLATELLGSRTLSLAEFATAVDNAVKSIIGAWSQLSAASKVTAVADHASSSTDEGTNGASTASQTFEVTTTAARQITEG